MKKDFISFLENPHTLVGALKKPYRTQSPILKREFVENHRERITAYVPGEIRESSPEIMVTEEDGEIKRIEFRCRCGCRALVELVPEADAPEPQA